MMLTLPVHYRDGGEPCPYGGIQTQDGICPNGCDGARYHYANDGHPECNESDPDIVEVIAMDVLDGPHQGFF